jgi:ATP:ADP antiporter, AAA family
VVEARRRIAAIPPAERTAVVWGFLYFFAILCGYYMLRPLRDEMGIVGGVRKLPWLFTATFVVMLIVVPFYSAVVSRFPRRKIIPIVYRFCALNLLVFLALDRGHVSEVWLARVFFVWVSVFNLFVVSVFWSFLVDTFRDDQGKRLFGAIATGGSLGAIAGPFLASVLIGPLGRGGLFLAAAILLEGAVFCVRRLIAWAQASGSGGVGTDPDRPVGGGAFAGFRLALKSPYLLAIAGMMLAYTITSTVIYADQARIVEASIKDSAARTALFARIDLWVNVVALIAQGLVTGTLLTVAGLGVALCILPFITAGGFVWLALAPGLATLMAVQIARRGLQYGLERPSREVLYTVVSPEEKYKAKAFIDTVIFRGGDAASLWAYDAVRSLGPPAAVVVTTGMLCVCGGWTVLAWFAGKRHAAIGGSDER